MEARLCTAPNDRLVLIAWPLALSNERDGVYRSKDEKSLMPGIRDRTCDISSKRDLVDCAMMGRLSMLPRTLVPSNADVPVEPVTAWLSWGVGVGQRV